METSIYKLFLSQNIKKMKKLILTLLFGLTTMFVSAQHASKANAADPLKAAFEFEAETIDYGKIQQHADGVRYFKFKNVGSSPLVIEKVKGSCGCTVPSKPDHPIMPGETGEIKVKYATNRLGRFSKTVTITSNATTTPKVVRIKGEVLKPEGK